MTEPHARLAEPPMPTWHGFDPDLLQKFATFALKERMEQKRNKPDRIKSELKDVTYTISNYTAALKSSRERKTELEAQLQALQESLQFTATDTEIQAEIDKVLALPFVIGTRTDMRGRLYLQLRITKTVDDTTYDLGDFEVGCAASEYHYGESVVVHAIRMPANISYQRYPNFCANRNIDNAIIGDVRAPHRLIRSVQLVELVQTVFDTLCDAYQPHSFPVISDPEMIWEGYAGNHLKAVRRSIELMPLRDVEAMIQNTETDLLYCGRDIEECTRAIREHQERQRKLRAALAEAEKHADSEIRLDVTEIQKTLERIARLPGVMGIKFTEDGVPVIHIRSSHEFKGRRFDMGDYEFTLRPNRWKRKLGVVKTVSTRGQYRIYWHGEDGQDGWFCFGGRAGELSELLEAGSYKEFVHLLINTLNSINPGDRDLRLLGRYTEIPRQAVWRYRARRRRLRRQPRRRE